MGIVRPGGKRIENIALPKGGSVIGRPSAADAIPAIGAVDLASVRETDDGALHATIHWYGSPWPSSDSLPPVPPAPRWRRWLARRLDSVLYWLDDARRRIDPDASDLW